MSKTAVTGNQAAHGTPHWMPVRLRYLGRLRGGAGFPDGEQGIQGEDLPFFKVKHLAEADGGVCLRSSEHTVSRDTASALGAFVFPAGTIVFAKVGAALLLNRFRFLGQASCIDNNMMGLVLDDRHADKRFMLHSLAMVDFGQVANPGAVPSLNAEQVAEQSVLLPPLPTQLAIADYLDRETARLDALVAAKERVLGLLAEKRRALITRAVTRGLPAEASARAGLDPRAPLHDSGIPWLGEIPAHWELWKIGHLAIVGNGSTPNRDNADYWAGGTVPWLNSSVVNQEEVTAADQFITEIALRECHLPIVKPGSVLVGITGQGKTRGTAVVLSFAATINQHLAYVTPNVDIADTWFLRWVLFAAYDFLRSVSDDAGGTKGALTCEEVAGIRVPLPPVSEQYAIVGHIAAETAKLDAMRAATERSIALLKERRAALIAAAVTGQIDVGSARYYTDDAASQKEPERRQ